MAECAHLIDRDSCADCRDRPVLRPDYGPWFEAGWPGECAGCYGEITIGDAIRSDGNRGWLCSSCGDRGGGLREVRPSSKYL